MTAASVDKSVLEALEDSVGADFLVELVQTFLEEAPKMLSDLRTAAQDGDAEGVRRAAHSLKSNANTFGAVEMADIARQIELEDLGEMPSARLAELTEAFEAAASMLRDMTDA